MFTGLTIAIVFTLVTVIGFAAFCYYKGYRPALPTMSAFENPLYFKSSKPDISDDKNLIPNIEIEPISSSG